MNKLAYRSYNPIANKIKKKKEILTLNCLEGANNSKSCENKKLDTKERAY